MASATRLNLDQDPQENPTQSQLPPHITPEQASAHFELAIALTLYAWPALSLAVQNNWGGPDSSDKRDWLGGEVLSQFESDPETDVVDVEERLLQVMQDEFEVAVDDESAYDIAECICRFYTLCSRGDFAEIVEMRGKWERKYASGAAGSAGVESAFRRVEGNEDDQDTDGSDVDDEDSEGDVEMGGGAPLRQPKEKVEPEIDEDGFQTVVSRRKR